MSEIVVGLDPDSNKHGVSVYVDGALKELLMLDLPALRRWIAQQVRPLRFAIEDVLSQNFVYARNVQRSKAAQGVISVKIGRCQQAQAEVMRELDDQGIEYSLHKPTSSNWAENKPMFERMTGWKGRSNSETRSAAYFGFVAVRQNRNLASRKGTQS